MAIEPKLVAERRRVVAAMSTWLNGDQWHKWSYSLPDGSVFPQTEAKAVLEEARRWVGDVVAFGWNLPRWREKHPEDWQKINLGLSLYRPSLILGSDGKPMYYFESADAKDLLPAHCWAFAELIMNPERERLGRCERCQRFYVSEGRYLRKRFCSRRCAHAVAAGRYIGRRYAAYRKQRLALARRLLRHWHPRHTDWKAWLVKKTRTGPVSLTRNFLTRCELRGELPPPRVPTKKGKRHAN